MSEHTEQALVISWAGYMAGTHPELRWLHSSLNGIMIPAPPKTRAMVIAHMKKEGMKPGIPDLFLPVARHGYHGLYIEMKIGGNKPTPEQKEFMAFAEQQGYLEEVCYSADEAIEMLQWYLEEK